MNEKIKIIAATFFDGYDAPATVLLMMEEMLDHGSITCQFDTGPAEDGHNASLLAPLLQPDGKVLWRVTAEHIVP